MVRPMSSDCRSATRGPRTTEGPATVVYGHTPVPDAEWLNNTICLDTGAVFGGQLTALRWPEKELVSVDAEREYYEPIRPLVEERAERAPLLLDVDDVWASTTSRPAWPVGSRSTPNVRAPRSR